LVLPLNGGKLEKKNFFAPNFRVHAKQAYPAECSHYAEAIMLSQKKAVGGSELRIRCDEELHRQLAEAARRSLRSMTREVIFRLKMSLSERQSPDHRR
jgi:predicted HicB family RNase H-like nuclease